MEPEWKFSAVLSDEVYQSIETVQMYCAVILDKKCTSSIVKKLNSVCPLPEFMHLKRVKAHQEKLMVLLLPYKKDIDPEQGKTEIQSSLIQGHELVGTGEIFITSVAKHKPVTRKQYEEANSYWPTNFHEDKRLERMLKDKLFSATELSEIGSFMNLETNTQAEPSVGAVIVDPTTREVITQAHTDPDHPTRHAVMVCIDNVAKKQGKGAWNDHSKRKKQVTYSSPMDETGTLAESKPPAKRHKQSSQYLCTGYDAYVSMEPCVMCAMALLHSRVRRVFYHHSNPFCGALGSQYKLHVQQGLNHRFEVYQGRRTANNVIGAGD